MKNKKVIIIVAIVIVVAIVLVAIFSGKDKNEKSTNEIITVTSTQQEQQEEKKAEEVKIGETVENDYIKMTLDKFEVETEYKFQYQEPMSIGGTYTKNNGIDGKSGMKLVCLRGNITNKTTKDIYTGNNFVKGEMIINGNTYKTTLKCFDTEHAESYLTVVAQQEVEYFLYAEVPENVANNIESCTINFGNVNNLDASKYVADMNDLDYLYSLQVK